MRYLQYLNRYFAPEQYVLWYGTFGLLALALLGWVWGIWATYGSNWCKWDFMFLTGVATFIITGVYSIGQERRFHTMLTDARTSGVMVSDRTADELAAELDLFVRRIAKISCTFVFLLMLVTLLIATLYDAMSGGSGNSNSCYSSKLLTSAEWRASNPECVTNLIFMMLVMTGCGALAGIRLGRVAGYGLALKRLPSLGVQLSPLPGHNDKRSGTLPFAKFLTSQALLTLPAVLWVFVWWLVIPYWGDLIGCNSASYDQWSTPFIGVWLAAVGFLWLAFLSPLRHLHKWMIEIKRDEFGPLMRQIETKIAEKHADVSNNHDSERRDQLRREIAELSSRHFEVRSINTWVIAPTVLRRLIVSYTVTVFWPLLYQVVISGQDVSKGAAAGIMALFKKLLGS